jgi:hypothetical protein
MALTQGGVSFSITHAFPKMLPHKKFMPYKIKVAPSHPFFQFLRYCLNISSKKNNTKKMLTPIPNHVLQDTQ